MFEFKAGQFHAATSRIVRLVALVRARGHDENSAFHKDRILEDEDREFLTNNLATIKEHLDTHGARATSLAIAEFEEYMKTGKVDWESVKDDLDDVEKTLSENYKCYLCLFLNRGRNPTSRQKSHFSVQNSQSDFFSMAHSS
jgi:hypothetical protein